MEENNGNNYEETQNAENFNAEVKEGEVVGEDGFSIQDKEENKLMAILSYLSFLSLIPYITEKKSRWVRYHSIQGVNVLIVSLIGLVLRVIPFVGWLASYVIGIYTLIISIIGIVNVCNGEAKELPLMNNFRFIKQ